MASPIISLKRSDFGSGNTGPSEKPRAVKIRPRSLGVNDRSLRQITAAVTESTGGSVPGRRCQLSPPPALA